MNRCSLPKFIRAEALCGKTFSVEIGPGTPLANLPGRGEESSKTTLSLERIALMAVGRRQAQQTGTQVSPQN
jgi:hypothetical protein